MHLLAGILSNWELLLILATILVLFASKRLPPAIGRALSGFRDAIDEMSFDAGRSVGGIHGKRAAEALTPDNQTGELYRPAVFDKPTPARRSINSFVRRISSLLRNLVRRILF